MSQLYLKVTRLYLANTVLLYDLLTSGSTTSYQDSWIESHKIDLTQLTEHMQTEMAGKIANKAIDRNC